MSGDSGLTLRQAATIAVAAAATGAALSVAFTLWRPRSSRQDQPGGSRAADERSPPRISPPLSPFQTAKQQRANGGQSLQAAPSSTASRCWDWLSSSQEVPLCDVASSGSVRLSPAASSPAPAAAASAPLEGARSCGDLDSVPSKPPGSELTVNVKPPPSAVGELAATVRTPVSEPSSVHTPSQQMVRLFWAMVPIRRYLLNA